MTKGKLVELLRGLEKLNVKGAKLNYAIERNRELIKREVNPLLEAMQKDLKNDEFEKKRMKLVEKHAVKEGGKMMMIDNEFQMKDFSAFEKEFNELKNKYKKEFKAQEKMIKDYEDLLKEESKIKFYKVKIEMITENPANNEIDSNQMRLIYNFIEKDGK